MKILSVRPAVAVVRDYLSDKLGVIDRLKKQAVLQEDGVAKRQ